MTDQDIAKIAAKVVEILKLNPPIEHHSPTSYQGPTMPDDFRQAVLEIVHEELRKAGKELPGSFKRGEL